jgi:hypothetical protein
MRRAMLLAAGCAAALLAGCSSKEAGAGEEASGGSGAGRAAAGATAAPAGAAASPGAPLAAAAPAAQTACRDYAAEAEPSDMVMIYHAASGLPPQTDKWAETILYKSDRQADPEGAWKQANAQIAAQYAAVAAVRCVTLRTGAGVRAYDAARGGLVVGALEPDTYYPFQAFGEQVRLKIRNAEAASVWKLPADRAEALMRGSYNLSGARLVARLRIVSARPSSGDGIIEADVDSFDIEAARDGAKLATIDVAGGR